VRRASLDLDAEEPEITEERLHRVEAFFEFFVHTGVLIVAADQFRIHLGAPLIPADVLIVPGIEVPGETIDDYFGVLLWPWVDLARHVRAPLSRRCAADTIAPTATVRRSHTTRGLHPRST
jgi:hypothetical protein